MGGRWRGRLFFRPGDGVNVKMSEAQRLAEFRIALRSLVSEAAHYPDALYKRVSLEHLRASIERARRVLAGGQWQPGEFEIDRRGRRQ